MPVDKVKTERAISALWITPWYPHDESPQEGDFIERMAFAVSKYAQVHVLAFHESKSRRWKIDKWTGKSIEVWHVYYPYWHWNPIRFLALTLAGVWCMLKLRKASFDVVHGHVVYPTGHLAVFFSELFKRPLLITEHSSVYFEGKSSKCWVKYYLEWTLKYASVLMPVSNSLKKNMQNFRLNGLYVVLPNIIDPQIFSPPVTPIRCNGTFKFIYIGVLEFSNKQVDKIVQAFAELCKVRDNVMLTLVGDGPNRKDLENMIEELGISSRCELTGMKPHDEVAHLMRTHHALVLFSKIETFSCVIAEALSVGLPIISSSCGGLSDKLSSRYGIVLNVDDVASLSNAMLNMTVNYQRFNPGKRREIVDSFTPDSVASSIFCLYNKCLN